MNIVNHEYKLHLGENAEGLKVSKTTIWLIVFFSGFAGT